MMTMKKFERKDMNVNELGRLSYITLSQCFNYSSTFQSHSMVLCPKMGFNRSLDCSWAVLFKCVSKLRWPLMGMHFLLWGVHRFFIIRCGCIDTNVIVWTVEVLFTCISIMYNIVWDKSKVKLVFMHWLIVF
jgi:hypothetical protein